MLTLVLFLALSSLFLFSCDIKVAPSNKDWSIEYCIYDVSFIDGITAPVKATACLEIKQPYAVLHNESTGIKFNTDGTLLFKPLNEEAIINGTFTFKHNIFEDRTASVTLIDIVLENGNEIGANIYEPHDGFYRLDFSYKDVRYTFSTNSDNIKSQEALNQEINEKICKSLRHYANGDKELPSDVKKATVYKSNDNYFIRVDGNETEITVNDSTPIFAYLLTAYDKLIKLNSLHENECYFTISQDGVITLYYVDTLSSSDEYFILSEIETWLNADPSDISKISIEDHHLGSCMGAYLELDDRYYINKVTELVSNMKLYKISSEEAQNITRDNGMQTNIYFHYAKEGFPSKTLLWVNGYLKDTNGVYYRCEGDFPNSDIISGSYLQAINSNYPEAESGWSARKFTLSDDPYDLWVYLLHPSLNCENMPAATETVAGYTFEYPQNYRIIVFYHDKLYSLTDAYKEGLIDVSDIKEIYAQYPKKLAELQKYSK
ncbi:MAG: hypothetical protein J6S23_04470 [Clostridia bacterium]|nr:hypothetical protein [Clostridia bacterium]